MILQELGLCVIGLIFLVAFRISLLLALRMFLLSLRRSNLLIMFKYSRTFILTMIVAKCLLPIIRIHVG